MPQKAAGPGLEFPPELAARPSGVLIWGDVRPAVHTVALAIARRISNAFLWVESREPDEPISAEEPSERGLISRGRLVLVRTAQVRPDDATANMAMWALAKGAGRDTHLADLLRLPEVVRTALLGTGESRRPRVLVAANLDHVQELYPSSIEGTRAIVEVFRRQAVSLVACLLGPDERRWAFDYVFRLEFPSPTKWRDGAIRCEKGISTGPLAEGSSVPLDAVASIRVLIR